MKLRIIRNGDYLLAVEPTQMGTKITGYYYNRYSRELCFTEGTEFTGNINLKIAAYFPLNGAPLLKGVDLLPIPKFERVCNCGLSESEHNVRHPFVAKDDEAVQLANEWAIGEGLEGEPNLGTNSALNKGFIAGYNRAKGKYQFTKEDISLFAAEIIAKLKLGELSNESDIIAIADSYQSENRLTPKEFECEMETDWKESTKIIMESYGDDPEKMQFEPRPKTRVDNIFGIKVLIGKYLY